MPNWTLEEPHRSRIERALAWAARMPAAESDVEAIASLHRHSGEDVDSAPPPAEILALAAASLANVPAAERRPLTRKLRETER